MPSVGVLWTHSCSDEFKRFTFSRKVNCCHIRSLHINLSVKLDLSRAIDYILIVLEIVLRIPL